MSNLPYWNYRILRKKWKKISTYKYMLCEVYYDKNGKPKAKSQNSISIDGEEKQEVIDTIKLIQLAINKPILDYDTLKEI